MTEKRTRKSWRERSSERGLEKLTRSWESEGHMRVQGCVHTQSWAHAQEKPDKDLGLIPGCTEALCKQEVKSYVARNLLAWELKDCPKHTESLEEGCEIYRFQDLKKTSVQSWAAL